MRTSSASTRSSSVSLLKPFMPVSLVCGWGWGIPSYLGGRRFDLKKHGGHAPRSAAGRPVPDHLKAKSLHGSSVSRRSRRNYVRRRAA